MRFFFNKISHEFEPLEPEDIPTTHTRSLPKLLPYQVAGRIRAFKKPKSMVKGDIFPRLMSQFGVLLAIPLTDIFYRDHEDISVAQDMET